MPDTTQTNIATEITRIQNDRNTIRSSHSVDILGGGNRTQNGLALRLVRLHTLSAEESSTTVRELNDDGRVDSSSSLQASIHRARVRAVHGGNGKAVLLGISEQLHRFITSEDTGMQETHSSGHIT